MSGQSVSPVVANRVCPVMAATTAHCGVCAYPCATGSVFSGHSSARGTEMPASVDQVASGAVVRSGPSPPSGLVSAAPHAVAASATIPAATSHLLLRILLSFTADQMGV